MSIFWASIEMLNLFKKISTRDAKYDMLILNKGILSGIFKGFLQKFPRKWWNTMQSYLVPVQSKQVKHPKKSSVLYA